MSAPDTNIEHQKANHAFPLLGIRVAMMFGALMLVSAVFYAVSNGTTPAGDSGVASGVDLLTSTVTVQTYMPMPQASE